MTSPRPLPPVSRNLPFADRLRVPLIAAPMFLVSGPDLVVEACCAGAIGAFPTANCRTTEDLERWMEEIGRRIAAHEAATGTRAAPLAPNLIVHKSNPRVEADLEILVRHGVELVIASVGPPGRIIPALHDAGVQVYVDVATMRHAERAIEAGADGLVLLTAGAGGQTGWANPLAFVRAVRQIWDGPVVLAGGISDGVALAAAQVLGCDLAYMGTRFIATDESMAKPEYKQMLVDSRFDDILLTRAFTGLESNMLRPSIEAAGLDPDNLPARGTIDVSKDISVEGRESRPKQWRDIWTAGHSVSGVPAILPARTLVEQTRNEWQAARA